MKNPRGGDLNWGQVARIAGGCALATVGLLLLTWVVARVVASRSVERARVQVAESRRVAGAAAPSPRGASEPRPAADPELVAIADEAEFLQPVPEETVERDTEVTRRQRVASRDLHAWLDMQLWRPHAWFDEPPAAVREHLESLRPDLARLEPWLARPESLALSGDRLLRLAKALLLDGVVLQRDGRTEEAAARAMLLWPLVNVALDSRAWDAWGSANTRLQVLALVRKTEVPRAWAGTLVPEEMRAAAVDDVLQEAEVLAEDAANASARDVLRRWNVEPTFARRLLMPLYRRRLAEQSRLLAAQAPRIGKDPMSWEEYSELQGQFGAPPIPLPEIARQAAMGLELSDLSEGQWSRPSPFDGMQEVERLLSHAELTRLVLDLRERRDADPALAWPATPERVESLVPGLVFHLQQPEPGHLRIQAAGGAWKDRADGGRLGAVVFLARPEPNP